MATIYCPNCGAETTDTVNYCPTCGYRINNQEPVACQNEEKNVLVRSNPSKRHTGKFVFLFVLLVIIGVCGYLYLDEIKTNTYNDFTRLYNTIARGATKSEEAGTLIHDVWRNCIWQTKDSSTDKYTRQESGEGVFYEDFNDALECLYEDDAFLSDLKKIQQCKTDAEELMKSLMKHPSSFDEEYGDFRECYNLFLRFSDLVLSPSGNLQSFTDNFNELDQELANKFKELDIYFE